MTAMTSMGTNRLTASSERTLGFHFRGSESRRHDQRGRSENNRLHDIPSLVFSSSGSGNRFVLHHLDELTDFMRLIRIGGDGGQFLAWALLVTDDALFDTITGKEM